MPTNVTASVAASQEAFQRRGRIVQRGEQAARRRRQPGRAAAGRPAGGDPEGAQHPDREHGREARQQRQAVIAVQQRPASGLHGERGGEGAAAGLDVPPQVAHVLPQVDQLTQPLQQAAAHHLVPAGARIGLGFAARDGGAHPVGLAARRRRPGAHPDAQIRQQALQVRGDPVRRPQRGQAVVDRGQQRQQQHHPPLQLAHPSCCRLHERGVVGELRGEHPEFDRVRRQPDVRGAAGRVVAAIQHLFGPGEGVADPGQDAPAQQRTQCAREHHGADDGRADDPEPRFPPPAPARCSRSPPAW